MSVSSFGARARGFFKAYKWLLSDFVSRAGLALSKVALFAAVFIMFRIFVFSAVVQLIKSIDYAFLSGQRDLEAFSRYPLGLIEAAVLAWCLVMLTATAGYIFYRSVFTSTHAHMHGLFERLLRALSARPTLGRPLLVHREGHAKLLTQVTTHVKLVNILSRILLFSIFESLSFLICLAVLLWLHVPTTLVLLGAGLLFMPLYYVLSLEGIRNRRNLKSANRDMSVALRAFEASMAAPAEQGSDTIDTFMKDPRLGKAFKLFQVQRMIVFKSEYAGWFLLASVAVICVLWIHFLSLQSVRISDWYFGIFLVMMYSLMRSLRSIVSSNRFLDSAIFCHRILGQSKAEGPLQPLDATMALKFFETPKRSIEIAPGNLVVIETAQARNMFALGAVTGQLHALGDTAVSVDILPFDASLGDIQRLRAKGCLPIFEARGTPDWEEMPDPLQETAKDFPLIVLVRKRLNAEFSKAAPTLVLTVSGAELVRHWWSEDGTAFVPYSEKKSQDGSADKDLDDDEFM